MDFQAIQLLIIALLPSIGTFIMGIVMVLKVCKQFLELRKEVKDDKTVNNLLKENKKINAQYKATLEKLDELSDKIETMAVTTEDLAIAIKNNNKET